MLPIRREALSWILVLLSLIGLSEPSSPASEARVVCYYTNWSIYRPGTAKFSPQNINPYLCTHLIYAFGGFTKDNKLKPFDKYQDIEKGGYAKFTGLKTYNKNLKTLLAIGGWNEGSSRFSSLVASPDRRREFTKNILKFLRQNHFDGLDLDWEYPAYRDGGKPRDKENYAQFVQELREEFERESQKTGRPRLLLTMAVPAGIEYIKKGYDIPKLNKYLDWFNLLSYDYHSAFEPSANHHAPLFPLEEDSEYNYDADLNIDHSIKFYLNEGADRNKLVLGIPTYGRSYTLLNEESTEIGAPTDGPGAQGDATREKGYLAYYEICQGIQNDDEWTVVQPNPRAMGPYAFKENQWVGYDDEAIARKKGEYVIANGLGGVMFWSIDNDDFRGSCHGRAYPIIEAAKEAMLQKLGGNENEVLAPSKRRKPSRSRSRSNSNSKTNSVANQDEEKISTRRPTQARRKPTQSSLVKEAVQYSSARTTTPEPPTTPDPGSDFKCEDEGFFPNPRDCKKYFWCLDSGPSNLGIVPHQFTCPSGLFFNKETDSCDYTRNVLCSKPKATTTTEISVTESTTKAKVSTVKSIFIGRPSTTTTELPEEDEEYEEELDEEDDKSDSLDSTFQGALEEEDPEVIKELITLIKKVGGLDELEKQLQLRLNLNRNSPIVSGELSKTTTTTTSPISQSLFNKVLNTKRGNSRNQFVVTNARITSESETEPLIQRQNKENRYSSVIRNSRPRPQNDGVDKLSEVEGGGVIGGRERPQYITLTRTQAPKASTASDDSAEEEQEEDDGINQYSVTEQLDDVVDDETPKRTVSTPQPAYQYVNIRRARPSTTTSKPDYSAESQADIEENEESEDSSAGKHSTTTRMQYVSIQRTRPTTVHTYQDDNENESVTPESKYKTVTRTRPSTVQPNIAVTEDVDELEEQRYTTTVESVNNQYLSSTPEITTTRTYGSVPRRRTTSTTQTKQFSTQSSSSLSYSLPSTTTTITSNTATAGSASNTNTHEPLVTTNTNNNDLDTIAELTTTLSTPAASSGDNDHLDEVITTSSSNYLGLKPPQTTSIASASDAKLTTYQSFIKNEKKTETLTQTNTKLTPTVSIINFSTVTTQDPISLQLSNQDKTDTLNVIPTTTDDSLISKLTTTTNSPNETPFNLPITTTIPLSAFVDNHPVEKINLTFADGGTIASTVSNKIESSTLYKPFVGIASSPRPFGFAKRTRPTTTTTEQYTTTIVTSAPSAETVVVTLSPPAKVSPETNARVDIRNLNFEQNLITKELQSLNQYRSSPSKHEQIISDAQVSGASSENQKNSFVKIADGSIANTTNDEIISKPETTLSSTAFTISDNSSAFSSTTTASSVVNISNSFASRRNASRVNILPEIQRHTENRVSRRRYRTRPTFSPNDSSGNHQEQQRVDFDDKVSHVTYNIARQRQPNEAAENSTTNLETENTQNVQRDRTAVIRSRQLRRQYRPKLNDLLRETSNGVPNLSKNQQQDDRSYRPEHESDISSLTAVDFNRKNEAVDRDHTRDFSLRRKPVLAVTDDVESTHVENERPVVPNRIRTRPTRVPITTSNDVNRLSPQRTTNRFNEARSRSRFTTSTTSAPIEDSAVEQSGNVVLNIVESSSPNDDIATETPTEQQNVRVTLARKINLDSSYENRLNSVQRKPSISLNQNKSPDSRILFLHPRRFTTKSPSLPPTDSEHTSLHTDDSDVAATTVSSLQYSNVNNDLEAQTTFEPPIDSLFVEAIDSNQSDLTEPNPAHDYLFRQRVLEIQNIVDSFKTTEHPSSISGNENAVVATEVALEQNNNGAIKSSSEIFVESGDDQKQRLGSTSNIFSGRQIYRRPRPTVSVENTQIDTDAGVVIQKRPLYARRQTSTTTESYSSSGENFNLDEQSIQNTNLRQIPTYRGRIKASNEVIAGYGSKNGISNVPTSTTDAPQMAEEHSDETLVNEIQPTENLTEQNLNDNSQNEAKNTAKSESNELTIQNVNGNNTNAVHHQQNATISANSLNRQRSNVVIRRRLIDARTRSTVAPVVEYVHDSNHTAGEKFNSSRHRQISLRRRRPISPQVQIEGEIQLNNAENGNKAETNSVSNLNETAERPYGSRRRRPTSYRESQRTTASLDINDNQLNSSESNQENGNSEEINISHSTTSRRRRPSYRGRTKALIQSEETIESEAANMAENNESNPNDAGDPNVKTVQTIGLRRRRIYGRPTTVTNVQDGNIEESPVNTNDENAVRQVIVRRRPIYGRPRTLTSTSTEIASELNENETDPIEENSTDSVVTVENLEESSENTENERQPTIRKGKTSATTTDFSQSSNENSVVSINAEERKVNQVRKKLIRRRPVFRARTTTTTESSAAENAGELNEENAFLSQENVDTQSLTNGRRIVFGRTRTRTTTEAASESNVQDENIKESDSNEQGNSVGVQIPTRRRRPLFGRARTTTTTESASDFNDDGESENAEQNQFREENQINEENAEIEQANVDDTLRYRTRTRIANTNNFDQSTVLRRRPTFPRFRTTSTTVNPTINQTEDNSDEQTADLEHDSLDEAALTQDENERVPAQRSRPSFHRPRVSTYRSQSNDYDSISKLRQSTRNRLRASISQNRPVTSVESQSFTQEQSSFPENGNAVKEVIVQNRFKPRKGTGYRRRTTTTETPQTDIDAANKNAENVENIANLSQERNRKIFGLRKAPIKPKVVEVTESENLAETTLSNDVGEFQTEAIDEVTQNTESTSVLPEIVEENTLTDSSDFFITQNAMEEEMATEQPMIDGANTENLLNTQTTDILAGVKSDVPIVLESTSQKPAQANALTQEGTKRRRKIRKQRKNKNSTTAAPIDELNSAQSADATASIDTSQQNSTAQVVIGVRESRKQFLSANQLKDNNLAETDSDRQTDARGNIEHRPKSFKGRVPYRPVRPSFSLTSTAVSSEISESTQRAYVRKYTKTFNLPKPPNVEEEFVPQNEETEQETYTTEENLNNESEQRFVIDEESNVESGHPDAPNETQHKHRFVPHNRPPHTFRPSNKIVNVPFNSYNNDRSENDDDERQAENDAKKSISLAKPSNRPIFGANKFLKNRLSLTATTTAHPASQSSNDHKHFQSTEPSVVLDSIDVNTISVRNQNIFSTSSKKHNLLKLRKSTTSTSSQLTNAEDDGDSITSTILPVTESEYTEQSPSFDSDSLIVGQSTDQSDINTNTLTTLTDSDDVDETTTTTSTHESLEQERSSTDITTDNFLNSINLVDILQASTTKPAKTYLKNASSTSPTPTTTTGKPTTFHHVFAIDYDESASASSDRAKSNEINEDRKNGEVVSKKTEKLAEVNRIVEVYSQQRKETIKNSSTSGNQKSETSNLIIERLPTVNKLGEISRVTLIKLVDHQNETKATIPDYLGFLTTTTKAPLASESETSHQKHAKKSRQIVQPDSIFSVETSTIPLEGLFQTDRNGKKLNIVYATTVDDSFAKQKQSSYAGNPSPVYVPSTTTPQTSSMPTTESSETTDSTANAVKTDVHVDKSAQITPTSEVVNDSTPPLVISLTNLDSVILSQVSSPSPSNSSHANTSNTASISNNSNTSSNTLVDGAVASSGKVRPQYRPGFRRHPALNLQKKSKPSQSNDITDQTEITTTTSGTTTRKTTNTPYIRRRASSRPTYIPTTSHTTVAALASTVSNRNNDTIVNKILQRRKFGRPSSSSSVSGSSYSKNSSNSGSSANERKRYNATQSKSRTTTTESATTDRTRTPNPFFRRRYGYTSTTPKPPKSTTSPIASSKPNENQETARNPDQELEPSIVDSKFSYSRFNQIDLGSQTLSEGLAEAITTISRAPLPFVASTTVRDVKLTTPGSIKYDDDSEYQITKRADYLAKKSSQRQRTSAAVTTKTTVDRSESLVPKSESSDQTNHARPSRDFKRTQRVNRTFSSVSSNSNSDPKTKTTATLKEKQKKIAFRPAADYDYYDDAGDSVIGKSNSKVKVILHDAGIIECLDQGNFPHPLSCRKFISCAKMEIGGVVGWEYTCPKGLSYDPVGGICNWAAGLGCKE